MSFLMDKTAAELADILRTLRTFRHNTGGLSMVTEATLAYQDLSPALGVAYRALADAGWKHRRSYSSATDTYSETAWDDVADAADQMATHLNVLGDYVLPRCKRPSAHGVCNAPLHYYPDGVCQSSVGHTDNL